MFARRFCGCELVSYLEFLFNTIDGMSYGLIFGYGFVWYVDFYLLSWRLHRKQPKYSTTKKSF